MTHKKGVDLTQEADKQVDAEVAVAHSESARDHVQATLGAHKNAGSNDSLIGVLKTRFESHPERHKMVEWNEVEKALSNNPFIGILRSRLESLPGYSVEIWMEIEKALVTHPDKLTELRKIEEAGGLLLVVSMNNDEILFKYYEKPSKGMALGHKNHEPHKPERPNARSYENAAEVASKFGVKLMTEADYRKTQKEATDVDASSWVKIVRVPRA